MSAVGKALIVAGAVLLAIGVLLLVSDKVPLVGKLPGDIRFKGQRFTFHFPLATCILLSIIFTIILNIVARFFLRGR